MKMKIKPTKIGPSNNYDVTGYFSLGTDVISFKIIRTKVGQMGSRGNEVKTCKSRIDGRIYLKSLLTLVYNQIIWSREIVSPQTYEISNSSFDIRY